MNNFLSLNGNTWLIISENLPDRKRIEAVVASSWPINAGEVLAFWDPMEQAKTTTIKDDCRTDSTDVGWVRCRSRSSVRPAGSPGAGAVLA